MIKDRVRFYKKIETVLTDFPHVFTLIAVITSIILK